MSVAPCRDKSSTSRRNLPLPVGRDGWRACPCSCRSRVADKESRTFRRRTGGRQSSVAPVRESHGQAPRLSGFAGSSTFLRRCLRMANVEPKTDAAGNQQKRAEKHLGKQKYPDEFGTKRVGHP